MCSRRDCHFRRKKTGPEQGLTARQLRISCAGLLLAMSIAAAQTVPSLNISPGNVVFPTTAVGVASPPLLIKVANPTNSSIQLEEIIVSGIDFSQTNNCAKELAAGASCSVQVIFKPAITGERMGSLEIAAWDNNVPHFVPLTGTGR